MIAIMAALRVAMTVAAGAGLFGRDSGVFGEINVFFHLYLNVTPGLLVLSLLVFYSL